MDDRVPFPRKPADVAAYIDAICGSDFEGCFCTRPKDHVGLHRCGNMADDCVPWTTADARRWHAQLGEHELGGEGP